MMNADFQIKLMNILYREAYLLDHRMYKEWLEMLTDDVQYQMPMRVTRENKDGSNILENMAFFEETKSSLKTRVDRLYTNSAWVDDPAPRQRHFVSNIVIEETSNPDEYRARSYFFFKRSRASDPETEEMFGEREDILRNVNGEWKIASRTIYPDQAVITTMNMCMFL